MFLKIRLLLWKHVKIYDVRELYMKPGTGLSITYAVFPTERGWKISPLDAFHKSQITSSFVMAARKSASFISYRPLYNVWFRHFAVIYGNADISTAWAINYTSNVGIEITTTLLHHIIVIAIICIMYGLIIHVAHWITAVLEIKLYYCNSMLEDWT